MNDRGTVLVLWNQVEEDIYEQWRREGPKPLAWDPNRFVPDVGTVAEEMEAMIKAIVDCGYRVHLVNIEDELDRVISSIRLYQPDVVMNLVEYFNDDSVQEAYVAGLYELLGVSYTGNRPLALSTCQNKYRTKVILEAAGLPTAPYILIDKEPIPTDHGLEYPVIVKPSMEDASGGIEHTSVVKDQAALEAQVRRVMKEYEMPVLVEEYIDGREIHAALLGNAPPEVLPLFEMEFDDSEFNPSSEWRPQIISYRAKWDPHSKEFYSMDSVCPAEELDEEIEDYIRDIAARAFKAMGCRDYARIDMRVDEEEGEVYILEVNPNPDLADGAAYMQCAVASGRTFGRALGEIIEMAMERARKATTVDPARANLPSDHLMREWVVSQRRGQHTTLPLSGASGRAAGLQPAAAAGGGPAVAAGSGPAEAAGSGPAEAAGDGLAEAAGSGPDVATGGVPDVATGGVPDVATGGGPDVATGSEPDVATGGGPARAEPAVSSEPATGLASALPEASPSLAGDGPDDANPGLSDAALLAASIPEAGPLASSPGEGSEATASPPVAASGLEAVESQTVESQAVESQAVESQAVEGQAVESQAVESQAVESQAVEGQAVESQTVESQAVESQAVRSESAQDGDTFPA